MNYVARAAINQFVSAFFARSTRVNAEVPRARNKRRAVLIKSHLWAFYSSGRNQTLLSWHVREFACKVRRINFVYDPASAERAIRSSSICLRRTHSRREIQRLSVRRYIRILLFHGSRTIGTARYSHRFQTNSLANAKHEFSLIILHVKITSSDLIINNGETFCFVRQLYINAETFQEFDTFISNLKQNIVNDF